MKRYFGFAATLVMTLIVSFVTPVLAHADVYQYAVTDPELGINFTFDESSLASSGTVTSGFTSVTVPAGHTLVGFGWNSVAGGPCNSGAIGSTAFQGFACAGDTLQALPNLNTTDVLLFAAGSFLSTGTFTATNLSGYTVTITDLSSSVPSAVPEPSSLFLLGTGALGFFGPIRRKLLHRV
jgi:hypothetical protein